MDLSAGSATPIPAAISRWGSRVEFSLITQKATWPGLISFSPSAREISLQLGGKIDDTRTILHAAMPAFRSASSKLDRRSRCLPTPFVRKIFFATKGICRAVRLPRETPRSLLKNRFGKSSKSARVGQFVCRARVRAAVLRTEQHAIVRRSRLRAQADF